ncbi:60S ribosomal protein L22-3-like [Raphanus sativus]|uniref:60S ribosomal protein L22-3-like n=1 Tax=Raphanus sativus TaxID=3726 RepID=A0A6J0M1W1_RAPSA|nr:60S ribosomal protein L22-3-like [Raphanus sativus]
MNVSTLGCREKRSWRFALEKFLRERIKVVCKALGDSVSVTRDKSKITVTSDGQFSKRVIAANMDRNLYELKYFNIAENEAEEED